MPTKRRRTSRALRQPLPAYLLVYFQTGQRAADAIPTIRDFAMMGHRPTTQARWREVRDEVLADWRRQGHTGPCWAERELETALQGDRP